MSATLELLKNNGLFCAQGMKLGLPFEYEPPVRLFAGGGNNCRFGAFSYSASLLNAVVLGRYCSVAHGVEILTDHPTDRLSTHPFSYQDIYGAPWTQPPLDKEDFHSLKSITLGNDVWVGAHVKFRGGVNVGTGAIVAAGSMVTKDVPPYSIVGGIPARLIRWRFPEEVRKRLLESEWWRYNLTGLNLDFKNPNGALNQLKILVDNNELQPWEPGWKRLEK